MNQTSPGRAGAGGAAALLLFAVALTLPGLGASGLWEPEELRLGEAAAVRADELAFGRPPLRTLWPALGMSLLGTSELAARLPLALAGIGLVLVVAWTGAGLGGRRAGLLAGAVLAATPLFVLQTRQLTSDVVLLLGTTAALGGLANFLRVERRRRALAALAVALAGLALGAAAGGVLLGVLAPLGAVLAAQALAGAALPDRGRQLALRVMAVAALGLGLLVVGSSFQAGEPSWLLGGTPTGTTSRVSFERLIAVHGFGLFPFGAAALLALLRPLADVDAPAGPDRFPDLYLLLAAAFGLAFAALGLHVHGEARAAALAPAALAVGRLLDRALAGERPPLLVAAFAALGAVLVGRDLLLAPEELVSLQRAANIAWPVTMGGAGWLLAVGLMAGGCLLATALPAAGGAPARVRRLAPWALLGVSAAFALALSHLALPALSRHLSHKQLVDTFRRLGQGTGKLAVYHVARAGTGSGAFELAAGFDIPTLPALAEAFRNSPAVYALVPRSELAAIDDHFAETGTSYAVADASSSRLLLLAARLPAGAADQNPLREFVWRPARAGAGAGPPWPAPRLPLSVTFGGAVELVGADMPPSVRRPNPLALTLHFRVHGRPPPDYKIFVHVERPGTFVVGDHPPLAGAFPTAHWRPGDVIRDRHEISVPLVTAGAGLYTVRVGFWPGGDTVKRLPITAGDSDGRDRALVGTIQVK